MINLKENDIENCPVRKTLRVLGTKWSMLIVMNLKENQRYGKLKKMIPNITEKVLISKLKILEESGFIKRKNYGEIPPRVEYGLTALGKDALNIIPALAEIGKKMKKSGKPAFCQPLRGQDIKLRCISRSEI